MIGSCFLSPFQFLNEAGMDNSIFIHFSNFHLSKWWNYVIALIEKKINVAKENYLISKHTKSNNQSENVLKYRGAPRQPNFEFNPVTPKFRERERERLHSSDTVKARKRLPLRLLVRFLIISSTLLQFTSHNNIQLICVFHVYIGTAPLINNTEFYFWCRNEINYELACSPVFILSLCICLMYKS